MTGRGKHKAVATQLALFLGWLGAHHFYLGSWAQGVLYLNVAVIGFCFGGTLLILAIGLVDAICLIQMDSEAFDKRFNDRTPRPFEPIFKRHRYVPREKREGN
jgi:TM2 domain-containing membrane protein YozV